MANKLYEFMTFDRGNFKLMEEVDETGGKNLYMSGLFIQGDVKNHNQRVYPSSEIARAVGTIRNKINSGYTVLGELDHPEELSINLDRVSHLITDMWFEGTNGFGKLKITPTPMGNIAKTLLQSGAKLGVSSRGSGNVDARGYVSDFEIVTVDIVAQPSAPDAYPRSIYESLYNMRGGSSLARLAEAAIHDESAKRYLVKDINKFIKDLKI